MTRPASKRHHSQSEQIPGRLVATGLIEEGNLQLQILLPNATFCDLVCILLRTVGIHIADTSFLRQLEARQAPRSDSLQLKSQ